MDLQMQFSRNVEEFVRIFISKAMMYLISWKLSMALLQNFPTPCANEILANTVLVHACEIILSVVLS